MTADITPETVERMAQANKNSDATDANMWRFWADKASALSAALIASQAETAANYAIATHALDMWAKNLRDDGFSNAAPVVIEKCSDIIRALTPADSKAALDRMIAEARAEGMREAAQYMQRHSHTHMTVDEIYAILAAIPKGTPHE
jgi:hypothetical protein